MSEQGWRWFPPVKTDWSLDVVNLLVVIGESAMVEHAQPITSSVLCVLPRIIPAPQIFLKPTRPTRMPDVSATLTGVYSGTMLRSVGFFANLVTPFEDLPPHSFVVREVKHASRRDHVEPSGGPQSGGRRRGLLSRLMAPRRQAIPRTDKGGEQLAPARDEEESTEAQDAEPVGVTTGRHHGNDDDDDVGGGGGGGGPKNTSRRRNAVGRRTLQDLLSLPKPRSEGDRPAIPPRLFSPLHLLSVLSFVVTVAILVCAAVWEDGPAIMAISLISVMSSLVGFASFWRPVLMTRSHNDETPAGDVVIRTREGAFVLVRCTEDVARELYSGTEECDYYVKGNGYYLLMATGAVFLMISVVLLGNCKWNSQVFIGASYITLNGLYWALGMLPPRYFWDMSRYHCETVTPRDSLSANEDTPGVDGPEGKASFTRTLWYAIRETGTAAWVRNSESAPQTKQWDVWLAEAGRNARDGNRAWDAVGRKNDIMKMREDDL
ncbi:hypothetical protein GMORB2_7672 [Geosmithia morbida]|uniref:Uncharacterized protein n=1 Tax=Geosmithia morbida TaxID=1094350 RepID=A0A9P4YUL6_9HYPO|nr:uncharacterized protein GMORB2_7672 [Geosmithia morbida]KAF4122079.1 hypothetical protein GMORB2_7672 [Geosmithia morbida]